jgi:hypothetical protein
MVWIDVTHEIVGGIHSKQPKRTLTPVLVSLGSFHTVKSYSWLQESQQWRQCRADPFATGTEFEREKRLGKKAEVDVMFDIVVDGLQDPHPSSME